MTETKLDSPRPRRWTRHLPGRLAVAAVIVGGVALTVALSQPEPDTMGLPLGIVAVAACTFVACLIVQIWAMSFADLFEAVLEVISNVFWYVVAALGMIAGAILGAIIGDL
jgi:sugar (pentulose or hexulose) kinase